MEHLSKSGPKVLKIAPKELQNRILGESLKKCFQNLWKEIPKLVPKLEKALFFIGVLFAKKDIFRKPVFSLKSIQL